MWRTCGEREESSLVVTYIGPVCSTVRVCMCVCNKWFVYRTWGGGARCNCICVNPKDTQIIITSPQLHFVEDVKEEGRLMENGLKNHGQETSQ